MIEVSERLKRLPPYLFKEIDRKKEELRAKGVDIIDLGVGDPDIPTPSHIVDAMSEAIRDVKNHRYPSYEGMKEFREAVARWYKRRFGVELDPETEVLALIGSKEGIAHLPLAFLNPGDMTLVPSPAYPVYGISTIFAGAEPVVMPLLKENDFRPTLSDIPQDILKKAKIIFLNYPNNPTSTCVDLDFFKEIVDFASKNRILVCHDAAYTEISFDGYSAPSFLQAEGAKEVGIEFHSLSKTYNMTGWRIGFAVGNSNAIDALGRVKSNIDSGLFQAIQIAAIAALDGDQSCVSEICSIYKERRDLMVNALKEIGFDLIIPKATFYLWIGTPKGLDSQEMTKRFLDVGVVVTPGIGFGKEGDGYVRMALTQGIDRLKEALDRIKGIAL